jgi:hypothetical protein
VRVLGKAAAVAADTGAAATTGAAAAAVEGTTGGAIGAVVDVGVAAVAVVVVVVVAGIEATGVAGGMGTTGRPIVATVERRVRITTNARASNTTTTTTRSRGSHGKLLLEAGAVLVVEGLLPVTEPPGWVGTPALAVSWASGASPVTTAGGAPPAVFTADGTCAVPAGCGTVVVAWASGPLDGAVSFEARAALPKTKIASSRLNRTAPRLKRLRTLFLLELDVERINERVTPPGLFEPRKAQARRLLYQVKSIKYKGPSCQFVTKLSVVSCQLSVDRRRTA